MRRNGVGPMFGAFIGGAIVGGVAALLLTTKTGSEMRKLVREFVEDEIDTAKEKAEDAYDFARDEVEKIAKKASAKRKMIEEKMSEFRPAGRKSAGRKSVAKVAKKDK